MARDIKHRRRFYIPAGMLNKIGDIYQRKLSAPPGTTTNFDLQFELLISVRMHIETSSGINMFGEVNIEDSATHKIYLRMVYSDDKTIYRLTTDNWIVHHTNRYRILRIENVNETDTFQILYCSLRGSVDKEASKIW